LANGAVLASGAMTFEDLRYDTNGHIATITLDRPEARNAYSAAMVTSLVAALDAAEADDSVRCIILSANGKSFHAGGDLKAMRDGTGMFSGAPLALRRQYIDGIQTIPKRFAACDKPIIAAVNGAAIGAGLDLACMCDLRVASTKAKFGSTFVKVGLVPGDGGAYFLARVVGFPRALELVLTGRLIDPQEALQIGLITQLVEPDALADAALALANQIAANAPLAVQMTKRAAYRSWDSNVDTALELAATYQGMVQNTEDHQRAVAAILGKSKPEFVGR